MNNENVFKMKIEIRMIRLAVTVVVVVDIIDCYTQSIHSNVIFQYRDSDDDQKKFFFSPLKKITII